ncbi:hypothetical protein B0T10DRAFT_486485 [Thelonectria olida]|uniref:Secreted protein n=1 Tax=Thelonectria olida TaxID=1576542 RepID=A0A9P8W551_9HYPO|nr:hypothetical protein B0T10DRAFT_486485 [Thelonectria olida]
MQRHLSLTCIHVTALVISRFTVSLHPTSPQIESWGCFVCPFQLSTCRKASLNLHTFPRAVSTTRGIYRRFLGMIARPPTPFK